MAPEHRRDTVAATRHRDVGPGGAGLLLKELADQITDRLDRASGLAQLAGLLLRCLDEVVHRLIGRVLPNDDERRVVDEIRDRREVEKLDVHFLARERQREPHRRVERNRVRIAFLLGDVRHRRGAPAPGAIQHVRPDRQQLLLLEEAVDDARKHIRAAAGSRVHDQIDRPRRLEALCDSVARQQREDCQHESDEPDAHYASPLPQPHEIA